MTFLVSRCSTIGVARIFRDTRRMACIAAATALTLSFAIPAFASPNSKLDAELLRRSQRGTDTVDVIATHIDGDDLSPRFRNYIHGKRLHVINGYWLQGVPVRLLPQLAADAHIARLAYNRSIRRQDALSSSAVLANALDPAHGIAQARYPYTGAGVRVAVLDSGFTSASTVDVADDRVAFVNFVDASPLRHDGYGHGTHVTGILAGSGASSSKYAGVAPGVRVVSLKVLDDQGNGSVGAVITALDWIYTHPEAGIRVVNLSIGAAITESYWSDPLTLATKALVDRGVTVVAAAGNAGLNANGQPQWGGITAPGNAPWVLTVCASSTNGTYDLSDDTIAGFSSAGPTAVDFAAKPDICAPGVGVVSLSDPGSTLYGLGAQASPTWLIGSTGRSSAAPYESLSGTSVAAPIVSGAVALMLEANPTLTPNLIKAVLQYTATQKPGVSPLKQGAGILDVSGAIALARSYASAASIARPAITAAAWSKQILWGNERIANALINPRGKAWRLGVVWGASLSLDGDNIIWGTDLLSLDNIIWGTDLLSLDNIIWGTSLLSLDNIVWGTSCGGANCRNVMWGTFDALDNIIWGTSLPGENIIWGTDLVSLDNIIWGTDLLSLDNIIWGTTVPQSVMWPVNAESK